MTDAQGPRKRCFVIGPIGAAGSEVRRHSDMFIELIVRHVLEGPQFSYAVMRGDHDPDPGLISPKMIREIVDSDLAVADLTGLNANVFYELGIRHAAKKPTIHMAASPTQIPFDLGGQRTIFYDVDNFVSIREARDALDRAVAEITRVEHLYTNPVIEADAIFQLGQSADPNDKLIARVLEKLDRLAPQPSPSVIHPPGAFGNIHPVSEEDHQKYEQVCAALNRLDLQGYPEVVTPIVLAVLKAFGVSGYPAYGTNGISLTLGDGRRRWINHKHPQAPKPSPPATAE